MKLNRHLLEEMIMQGYVMKQKHPDQDLYIYNYTQTAQYERVWNEVTLACRGLILDGNDNIVARPFPKFFNLEEPENLHLPSGPFRVFEKLDGSLGILYFVDGKPFIATRGSFVSEQAQEATKMLYSRYADSIDQLDTDYTYLFEIIYPENRIVVDYGDKRALIMIGKIHTASGREVEIENIGFPLVKEYDGLKDFQLLKALNIDNREGFVIRFDDGYRLKIKFEEYQRLHAVITMVSSVTIWEWLKDELPFEEILEKVPDEFYQWVHQKADELNSRYDEILAVAKSEYKELDSRKETALYFQQCTYPSILFNMLDGKPVSKTIWRMIRPEFEKPFTSKREKETK